MLRKISLGLVSIAVLAVIAGSGVVWWMTPVPCRGAFPVPGADTSLEVICDENAIPHIFAGSERDAYYALGYMHARERLWQMEFMRRLGAGRLAEVLGEPALKVDRFIRTLGLYRISEEDTGRLPPDMRAAFDAYAAGVNQWLSTRPEPLPPEFHLLGFEPETWKVADSLVWGRLMALRLGRNWQAELVQERLVQSLSKRNLPLKWLDELWPDNPDTAPITLRHASRQAALDVDRIWESLPHGLTHGASNTWVVHGRHTDTGKPILANDPHLAFGVPGTWYLARIETPQLKLTGATVPGVPFTLLGHNGRIAWGITNGRGDAMDLFIETVDPDDPGKYLAPGGSLPFETRDETIRIKGGESETLTVRTTRHGPVISGVSTAAGEVVKENTVLAFASTILAADDATAEAVYRINRAGNWQQFLAAAENFHSPHQNLMFAATDGDIGYVSPARLPIRRTGDGDAPVPGAEGTYDWKGYIPVSMIPKAHNPPSGRIINANNRVVGDDYPYLITRNWTMTYRATRIVEVLDSQTRHTVADSEALQRDIVSVAARRLLPLMLTVEPASERARKAVGMLSGWDHAMSRDRAEPLIYTAWQRQLFAAIVDDELTPAIVDDYVDLAYSARTRFLEVVLEDDNRWCDDIATEKKESCKERLALSLEKALTELENEHGADPAEWRWGTAHIATFSHRILTKVPIVRRFADLEIESDGGDRTVNRGSSASMRPGKSLRHIDGAGYRGVFDLSDLDNSRFVITPGQSGNFLSGDYDHLLERWRDGTYITITGTRDELRARGR
jgi:penicillin amidase